MSASKDFNDLLYNVSRKYEGSKLKELRFLLNDHCDGSTLADKHGGAFDLFRELETKGYISNDPTDVEILLDTAEETETADASKLIKAFKTKYPNMETGYEYTKNNQITPFRKKLLKVIKKNTNGVQSMAVIYKLGHVPFDSKWDFIFRLEKDCKLINTPDSLKEFAKCLSENASKILLGTSQPGTSQSGTSQSGTSQPGALQPGTSQPGTSQPGTSQSGTSQSGTSQPGASQSGTSQPGTSQSGTSQSGTSQSGTSTESPNTTRDGGASQEGTSKESPNTTRDRGASQEDETDNPGAATSTTPMETSI
ncbi:uncharacterized protein [Antedon mediterranea]|uniref:uncharacterized protein isoform X3 n=1 Tax=Antedon mediterranea TaxID=105859 RepID=UPI003AF97D2B